jgi:hypothetical protein
MLIERIVFQALTGWFLKIGLAYRNFKTKAVLYAIRPKKWSCRMRIVPRGIVHRAIDAACECTHALTKVTASLPNIDKTRHLARPHSVEPRSTWELAAQIVEWHPRRPLPPAPIGVINIH